MRPRGGNHATGGLDAVPTADSEPADVTGKLVSSALLSGAVLLSVAIGATVLLRVLDGKNRARVDVLVPAAQVESTVDLSLIDEAEIDAWVRRLASPELGGRDAPSVGLRTAQSLVAREFARIGLEPMPDAAEARRGVRGPSDVALDRALLNTDGFAVDPWLRPFVADAGFFGQQAFERPDPGACWLRVGGDEGGPPLELYRDYVPLSGSSVEDDTFRGSCEGQAVFAGYGIDSRAEGYDDFEDLDVAGNIVVLLAGEPRGGAFPDDAFGGAEVTAEAAIWNKLDAAARVGAAGAIVVSEKPLRFHRTVATWSPPSFDRVRGGVPTLVVTEAAASRVLGRSVAALREQLLDAGAPLRVPAAAQRVALSAGTERAPATLYNVVGRLAATVESNAARPLVIGAHLDHVGVGPRGRIALGADDNASGVAALLGVARALAALPDRRRDVVFCAFSGEEDGLLGSRALAAEWQGAGVSPVAMLNLDMVGHGPADQVALFGLGTAPDLRRRVDQALSVEGHGVAQIQAVDQPRFFERSDHFAFHETGVPVLFFFEEWPHSSRVYHTWRDTPETVDMQKVSNTARLAAVVAASWLRPAIGG